MKTPEDVSKARQKIRNQADKWRAEVAAARRELALALDPAKQSEVLQRITYGQAQIILCAVEMKKLKRNQGPYWPMPKN